MSSEISIECSPYEDKLTDEYEIKKIDYKVIPVELLKSPTINSNFIILAFIMFFFIELSKHVHDGNKIINTFLIKQNGDFSSGKIYVLLISMGVLSYILFSLISDTKSNINLSQFEMFLILSTTIITICCFTTLFSYAIFRLISSIKDILDEVKKPSSPGTNFFMTKVSLFLLLSVVAAFFLTEITYIISKVIGIPLNLGFISKYLFNVSEVALWFIMFFVIFFGLFLVCKINFLFIPILFTLLLNILMKIANLTFRFKFFILLVLIISLIMFVLPEIKLLINLDASPNISRGALLDEVAAFIVIVATMASIFISANDITVYNPDQSRLNNIAETLRPQGRTADEAG